MPNNRWDCGLTNSIYQFARRYYLLVESYGVRLYSDDYKVDEVMGPAATICK